VGALAALRGACSAPAVEGPEEGDAAVPLRQLLRRFPPADSAAAAAAAAAATAAVDVADAARAGDSRLALLRCASHALAASGARAARTLAADSALLRAAADALSSPRAGSGAAELLDLLHGAVSVCGAAASQGSQASPPPPSPSSTGAVADGAAPQTPPTPPPPPAHIARARIYEAVSAAFGAAHGEAQAHLLAAVQGRAFEAGWLLLELRLRLPPPPPPKAAATAAATLAADDDADAAEAGGVSFGPFCATLRPPPMSPDARGGLLLRLQASLARCVLARRTWPAADAAALAVLCGRLHRLAEKRGAAAVAAGLALAEASLQRQAAAAALAATPATPLATPHKAVEEAPHEKENVGPAPSAALA